jgi:hypothetical protein
VVAKGMAAEMSTAPGSKVKPPALAFDQPTTTAPAPLGLKTTLR